MADIQVVEMAGGRCRVLMGDVREALKAVPAGSVNCCVSSPPYWALRSYLGKDDPLKPLEIGGEKTPEEYISNLVGVYEGVKRAMHETGVCWVNLGDSYGGKDGSQQCLIPHRFALAMQAAGWYLRSTVVWKKASPMPESVNGWRWERCRIKIGKQKAIPSNAGELGDIKHGKPYSVSPDWLAQWQDCPGCDKCRSNGGYVLRRGNWRSTTGHEYIFQFAKSDGYFCDAEAVKEPAATSTISRNKYTRILDDPDEQFSVQHDHEFAGSTANPRSVWTISPEPCKFAHYASFPSGLPRRCIRASVSEKGRCPKCGVPWSPVVEKQKNIDQKDRIADRQAKPKGDENRTTAPNQSLVESYSVLDYRPSCQCPPADSVPCLVMDPFAGTGTTLAVAVELGCEAIGVELNPAYLPMIEERLKDADKARKRIPVPIEADKPIEGKVSFF